MVPGASAACRATRPTTPGWSTVCTRLGELFGDARWTAEAVGLAGELLRLFGDGAGGLLHDRGRCRAAHRAAPWSATMA